MSDTTPDLTIPRVMEVLHGHTDQNTAYVVDDYPYGRVLRCKIRYWVHTNNKGAQRFMSQTTNPKRAGEVWNKPKASTYSAMVILYRDAVKGHVHGHHVSIWVDGPADARIRAMGIFDAFTEEQFNDYGTLLSVSQKVNPRTWDDWHKRVAELADHLAANDGADPRLENGVWVDHPDGKPRYLSDPAAYVTAARNLLATR